MKTWEIEAITSVPKFLAAVATHLPAATIASFEIQGACPEAQQAFLKHRTAPNLRPFRDTVFPKTHLYYCLISRALADDLEAVLRDHQVKDVLWHVKGYDGRKLLFAIHDADSGGSACISPHVSAEAVQNIAASLGRTATIIQTGHNWDFDHQRKQKEQRKNI